MSNPVDEYLEVCLEKTAGPGTNPWAYGKKVIRGMERGVDPDRLGGLLTGVGIVGGGALLVAAADKAMMAATKSKHQREMLEMNPDLVEHQANDPKMFNQHYTSLRNLNPRFAKDPVVAGAYMRRMSEFPNNAGPILVESLKDNKPGTGLKDFSTALTIAGQAAAE